MAAVSFLDAQNFDPQNFKWWAFHPLIKPLLSYHTLVSDVFRKPISPEKSCRDLIGRVAIVVSTPLGYLGSTLLALIGLVCEFVLRIDAGRKERNGIMEIAALAGRSDIVTGLLNLKRHRNQDLFVPIADAGGGGHRQIVVDLLNQLDVNAPLDTSHYRLGISGRKYVITYFTANKDLHEYRDLAQKRFDLWKTT